MIRKIGVTLQIWPENMDHFMPGIVETEEINASITVSPWRRRKEYDYRIEIGMGNLEIGSISIYLSRGGVLELINLLEAALIENEEAICRERGYKDVKSKEIS